MKKILLIFLLFLLPISANAKIFQLSKCYIYKHGTGVDGLAYSSFKHMKSTIYMSGNDKKNNIYPNDAVLDVIFQIDTKNQLIKEIWHYSDEYAAREAKAKREGPLRHLYEDPNMFNEKFDTSTFKLNNYISGIVEGYNVKKKDYKIRIDINKSEILKSNMRGSYEAINIFRCEIGGKKKSHYLDYWWAVILIIAITFFIFTQSGKRLKKIRRK